MYGQRIHEVLHFVQMAEYIGAVHPGRVSRGKDGCRYLPSDVRLYFPRQLNLVGL